MPPILRRLTAKLCDAVDAFLALTAKDWNTPERAAVVKAREAMPRFQKQLRVRGTHGKAQPGPTATHPDAGQLDMLPVRDQHASVAGKAKRTRRHGR